MARYRKSALPKAKPCTRAICWHRSIRGPIRQPTNKRSPPRRRMRRMLANAKLDLDRYILLQPQDLASKQTVDTARANVDQLTRTGAGRSGRGRQRAHATRLHAHHLADRRPHGNSAHRSGQYRARGGHGRDSRGHPGATHIGCVHPARRGFDCCRRGARRGARASHDTVARRQYRAGSGHALADRQ